MSYTKTTWTNTATALSADNMNHIEGGIKDAHDDLDTLASNVYTKSEVYAKDDFIIFTGTVNNISAYSEYTKKLATMAELGAYGVSSPFDLVLIGISTGTSSSGTANLGTSLAPKISGVSEFNSATPKAYVVPTGAGINDGLFIDLYNSNNYKASVYYKAVFLKIA